MREYCQIPFGKKISIGNRMMKTVKNSESKEVLRMELTKKYDKILEIHQVLEQLKEMVGRFVCQKHKHKMWKII